MTFKLNQDTFIQQNFSFDEFPKCGLSYTLTPNDMSFVTFDPAARKISIYTDKNSDAGVYNSTLSVMPVTLGAKLKILF